MPPADSVEMYVALMNFTGSVHPNIVANVNQASLLWLLHLCSCPMPACQPASRQPEESAVAQF
jgi:hypothetical protein